MGSNKSLIMTQDYFKKCNSLLICCELNRRQRHNSFFHLSLTHTHTHSHTLHACTHSRTQAQTLTPTDIHTPEHTHTCAHHVHMHTFRHIQFRLIKWHCLAMFAGISCPLLFDELLHLALLFQSLELFCKLQLVNISWKRKKNRIKNSRFSTTTV